MVTISCCHASGKPVVCDFGRPTLSVALRGLTFAPRRSLAQTTSDRNAPALRSYIRLAEKNTHTPAKVQTVWRYLTGTYRSMLA